MNEVPEQRMKARPEDKLAFNSPRGGFPLVPVLVGLIILVAIIWWFFPGTDEAETQPETDSVAVQEQTVVEPLPPAEDIPEPVAPPVTDTATDSTEVEVEEPLPALDQSDAALRQELAAAGAGSTFDQLRNSDNLAQLLVALVDSTSRGVIQRKNLPLERPESAFRVEEQDGRSYMSPAGYSRYDHYVDAITKLDPAVLVANFHRFRPLYEAAYGQLGLDSDDFDNAVIRTLDRVLATPEIEEPIAVKSKEAVYVYADPELEGLSSMQKQLLRMGPENLRRLKQQARQLRESLLQNP